MNLVKTSYEGNKLYFYKMDIMQHSACLAINPFMVNSYGFLFNCTMVGQASLNDGPEVKLSYVGWCLMLIFGWVHHGLTLRFSLDLTICKLQAFFFVSF